MNDLEDKQETVLIANLPPHPDRAEVYPLKLLYDPKRIKYMFLYHKYPLWMTGSREFICHRERFSSSTTRKLEKIFRCKWLHCGQLFGWLQHQPESYDNRGEPGTESWQSYYETDFTFDPQTQTWCKEFIYREVSNFYGTTYRDSEKVTLIVDLIGIKGSYTYNSHRETLE